MSMLKGDGFNIEWVTFNIREAVDQLNSLLQELNNGNCLEYGYIPLSIHLNDALRHLCSAWNTKWLADVDALLKNDERYERAATSLPNFDDVFTLVDAFADLGFDDRPRDKKGNLI